MEHILRKSDIMMAKDYYEKADILGFFHLFTLGAVPFRNSKLFKILLPVLEAIDGVFLKLPVVKWQAWQVIFALCDPK